MFWNRCKAEKRDMSAGLSAYVEDGREGSEHEVRDEAVFGNMGV